MSDRDGKLTAPFDHGLAAALRALPGAGAAPDLWPELARALAQRRRSRLRRYAAPIALAAGVALAVLAPRGSMHAPARPAEPALVAVPALATQTAASAQLADLHTRSQTLQRWIAAVSAHAAQDSRDLMAAVEIEDLIGLVDVQLDASRGDSDALPLWRQRVALLEDLAAIRGGAFALAANDDAAHTLPAHRLQH